MVEIDRLSQYRYLIRAMRLEDKRSLEVARAHFVRQGINIFDDNFVFRHAPFNDGFEQVTRNFFGAIEQRKVPGGRRFHQLLDQYVTLFLDEACCGSWDDYLGLAGSRLVICCQFCGSQRDLGGTPVERTPSVAANRKMLVERFGPHTEERWADTKALAVMQRRLDID